MEIVTVTKNNLTEEHICCAISNNNDCQVSSKKQWLFDRFDDGLVFKKCNVRGKCFVEYIPAENAWAPIEASGYMYINCLWVAGKFKGQGYANLLLGECIKDSMQKDRKGLVILSSKKKMPFLSDPKFLTHKGFQLADSADPYYELMYLPFEENSLKPQFKSHIKEPQISGPGFVLYYSNQCPYTSKYVPIIENVAREKGVELTSIHFSTALQAQNSPAIFTSYSLFYNGKYLTNEILTDKKFEMLIEEKAVK